MNFQVQPLQHQGGSFMQQPQQLHQLPQQQGGTFMQQPQLQQLPQQQGGSSILQQGFMPLQQQQGMMGQMNAQQIQQQIQLLQQQQLLLQQQQQQQRMLSPQLMMTPQPMMTQPSMFPMMQPQMFSPYGMMMPQMPQQQQQQQQTIVEEKKATPKATKVEGPKYDKETEDLKIVAKINHRAPFLSVRRLTISVTDRGTVNITQLEADFVSITVAKKGKVAIHHLIARRLEVSIGNNGFCKIGGPGSTTSKALEQDIKVSGKGIFDGRLCRGKNVAKHVTQQGRALVCETDRMRVLSNKKRGK